MQYIYNPIEFKFSGLHVHVYMTDSQNIFINNFRIYLPVPVIKNILNHTL